MTFRHKQTINQCFVLFCNFGAGISIHQFSFFFLLPYTVKDYVYYIIISTIIQLGLASVCCCWWWFVVGWNGRMNMQIFGSKWTTLAFSGFPLFYPLSSPFGLFYHFVFVSNISVWKFYLLRTLYFDGIGIDKCFDFHVPMGPYHVDSAHR